MRIQSIGTRTANDERQVTITFPPGVITNVPVKVTLNDFDYVHASGSPTFIIGRDGGGFLNAGTSINSISGNQTEATFFPSNAGAPQPFMEFGASGASNHTLAFLHNTTNFAGTYVLDMLIEADYGSGYELVDSTGIVVSGWDNAFSAPPNTADLIVGGQFQLVGGAPVCFWEDLVRTEQVCE